MLPLTAAGRVRRTVRAPARPPLDTALPIVTTIGPRSPAPTTLARCWTGPSSVSSRVALRVGAARLQVPRVRSSMSSPRSTDAPAQPHVLGCPRGAGTSLPALNRRLRASRWSLAATEGDDLAPSASTWRASLVERPNAAHRAARRFATLALRAARCSVGYPHCRPVSPSAAARAFATAHRAREKNAFRHRARNVCWQRAARTREAGCAEKACLLLRDISVPRFTIGA